MTEADIPTLPQRSDRPRLILHVGVHKTGSTSIQHHLAHRTDDLLRLGIHYPRHRGSINHRRFGRILLTAACPGQAADAAAMWHRWVHRHPDHDVLLSYEALHALGIRRGAAWRRDMLRALWERYDIHVVCYLRRPDTWVAALYHQLIKSNTECRSAEEFARLHIERPRRFDRALSFFADELGATVIVRPFDPHYLRDGDAVADFLHVTNLLPHIGVPRRPVRKNARLGARTLELKRKINRRIRHKAVAWLIGRALVPVSALVERGAPPPLPPATARAVVEAYAPIMRAVAHRFWSGPGPFPFVD